MLGLARLLHNGLDNAGATVWDYAMGVPTYVEVPLCLEGSVVKVCGSALLRWGSRTCLGPQKSKTCNLSPVQQTITKMSANPKPQCKNEIRSETTPFNQHHRHNGASIPNR